MHVLELSLSVESGLLTTEYENSKNGRIICMLEYAFGRLTRLRHSCGRITLFLRSIIDNAHSKIIVCDITVRLGQYVCISRVYTLKDFQ